MRDTNRFKIFEVDKDAQSSKHHSFQLGAAIKIPIHTEPSGLFK